MQVLTLLLNKLKHFVMTISDRLKHFWHIVSNIRPIVWIGSYVALIPIFALFYLWLPDGQFRIPDGGGTDYGSWLYYSIVTITTLGFGDYTPAHAGAQLVTAVEVMCGLIILGLFLNAVGSMKSEIDVASEIEKQKALHFSQEKEKLVNSTPAVMHNLNRFLAFCYVATTPISRRNADGEFNPDFTLADMSDLDKPSGLSTDHSTRPAVDGLIRCAARLSLGLDSLQNHIDLTLWPELLEDCFAFVANFQMFSDADASAAIVRALKQLPPDTTAEAVATDPQMAPLSELYTFIKENGAMARNIEATLTKIANS